MDVQYSNALTRYCVFQVFGKAVIGKAGLIIFSLLVALATFGTAHSSQFTAARSAHDHPHNLCIATMTPIIILIIIIDRYLSHLEMVICQRCSVEYM